MVSGRDVWYSKRAMTSANAIHNIEDFIRILREQSDVRDAVRLEILTYELMETPSRLDTLIEIQTEMARTLTEQARIQSEQGRALAEQSKTLAEQGKTLAEHSRIQTEILAVLREHSESISDLKDDVSELKGQAAYQAAKDRYAIIAFEMGLEDSQLLTPAEIVKMSTLDGASEYARNELDSFRDCDLVIAANSPAEGRCYIAVQVSYTVAHNDISRAILHSQMITRFTGRSAYAAVAGIAVAGVTENRLASGSAHWHRIPRRAMRSR